MSRLISRDPFARTELHRRAERAISALFGCDWCGQFRRQYFLYRYYTETDGGCTHIDPNMFCSLDCRRAYYG